MPMINMENENQKVGLLCCLICQCVVRLLLLLSDIVIFAVVVSIASSLLCYSLLAYSVLQFNCSTLGGCVPCIY